MKFKVLFKRLDMSPQSLQDNIKQQIDSNYLIDLDSFTYKFHIPYFKGICINYCAVFIFNVTQYNNLNDDFLDSIKLIQNVKYVVDNSNHMKSDKDDVLFYYDQNKKLNIMTYQEFIDYLMLRND